MRITLARILATVWSSGIVSSFCDQFGENNHRIMERKKFAASFQDCKDKSNCPM